jgi:hypothetical protein
MPKDRSVPSSTREAAAKSVRQRTTMEVGVPSCRYGPRVMPGMPSSVADSSISMARSVDAEACWCTSMASEFVPMTSKLSDAVTSMVS